MLLASHVSQRSKSTQLAHLYRNPRIGEVLHLLHVIPPVHVQIFSGGYTSIYANHNIEALTVNVS